MPQADSNALSLRYAPQAAFGGTPSSGAYRILPVNSNALDHTKRTVVSQRLIQDFSVPGILEVGAGMTGSLPIEWDLKNFQEILESLVGGVWSGGNVQGAGTGGTLRNPVTGSIVEKYLDIEFHQTDLTGAFARFLSARCSQLTLDIAAGSIITGTMNFFGQQGQAAATALGSGVTPEFAGTSAPILTATTGVTAIEIDDVAVSRKCRRISLDINANISPKDAVAEKFAIGLTRGQLNVGGSIEWYYEDNALFQAFVAHQRAKIMIELTDAVGNTMDIIIPGAHYTGGTPTQPGVNTPAQQTTPFNAEREDEGGLMIQFNYANAA